MGEFLWCCHEFPFKCNTERFLFSTVAGVEKDLFARFKIGHLFDFFPSEVSKTPSAHKSRQQDPLQPERTCHKRAGTN